MLVGLEIKREILVGELNSISKITLPGLAAVGGMLAPALIYLFSVHPHTSLYHGWAVPTATDIAFSLALVSLLGPRVPISLKAYLTAIAIFDDIGAIIIIAIFYTAKISLIMLGLAALCLTGLVLLNRLKVQRISAYILLGILLWLCVLKSGVHATLAGVAVAAAIPINTEQPSQSPLHWLESMLHPWVVFCILPLFGFANAGVSFAGLHLDKLFGPLTLGIAGGLFIGKQLGIFGATWLAVKLGLAELPNGTTWGSVYAIALICGVGFTMSLFIGTLAFQEVGTPHAALVRFGVLLGSLGSGALGFALLAFVFRRPHHHSHSPPSPRR